VPTDEPVDKPGDEPPPHDVRDDEIKMDLGEAQDPISVLLAALLPWR
jgi:hypothetical protein